jgi:hypothetical protein
MTDEEAFTAVYEAGRAIGVAQERAAKLRRKLAEEGDADPVEVGAAFAAVDQMNAAGEEMERVVVAWMAERPD